VPAIQHELKHNMRVTM